MLAAETLGKVQELDNQLHQAAESYRRVLELAGEHPLPNVEEVHLGLARISYEWNDLDAAEQHGQQSRQLARLYDRAIDRSIASDVFLARVALARGDVEGAAAMLAQAQRSAHENGFVLRLPEIAAAQVLDPDQTGPGGRRRSTGRDSTNSRSARRACSSPRATRRPRWRCWNPWAGRWKPGAGRTSGSGRWFCRRSPSTHSAKKARAARTLGDALALAEPGGFIRLFVDEGAPMAELLSAAAAQGIRPDYAGRLLAAFAAEAKA